MTKTNKAINQISYLIRCPICYAQYSNSSPPVTLVCGHSLCRECVLKLRKRSCNLKCPIEGKIVRMTMIRVNKDMLELIENYQSLMKIPLEKPQQDDAQVACNLDQSDESMQINYMLNYWMAYMSQIQNLWNQYLAFFDPAQAQEQGYQQDFYNSKLDQTLNSKILLEEFSSCGVYNIVVIDRWEVYDQSELILWIDREEIYFSC